MEIYFSIFPLSFNYKVMYKDVLRHIEDVATFPVISFGIFFIFFISVVVYAWGITKPTINEMENIPLKD